MHACRVRIFRCSQSEVLLGPSGHISGCQCSTLHASNAHGDQSSASSSRFLFAEAATALLGPSETLLWQLRVLSVLLALLALLVLLQPPSGGSTTATAHRIEHSTPFCCAMAHHRPLEAATRAAEAAQKKFTPFGPHTITRLPAERSHPAGHACGVTSFQHSLPGAAVCGIRWQFRTSVLSGSRCHNVRVVPVSFRSKIVSTAHFIEYHGGEPHYCLGACLRNRHHFAWVHKTFVFLCFQARRQLNIKTRRIFVNKPQEDFCEQAAMMRLAW